jgi:hypothetical protein
MYSTFSDTPVVFGILHFAVECKTVRAMNPCSQTVLSPQSSRSAIWAALADYFVVCHDLELGVASVIKSYAKIGREFGF